MDLTNPPEMKELLAPKIEPIDTSFIKTEKIEENQFIISGIVQNDEDLIKKEIIENKAIPSSSKVN